MANGEAVLGLTFFLGMAFLLFWTFFSIVGAIYYSNWSPKFDLKDVHIRHLNVSAAQELSYDMDVLITARHFSGLRRIEQFSYELRTSHGGKRIGSSSVPGFHPIANKVRDPPALHFLISPPSFLPTHNGLLGILRFSINPSHFGTKVWNSYRYSIALPSASPHNFRTIWYSPALLSASFIIFWDKLELIKSSCASSCHRDMPHFESKDRNRNIKSNCCLDLSFPRPWK